MFEAEKTIKYYLVSVTKNKSENLRKCSALFGKLRYFTSTKEIEGVIYYGLYCVKNVKFKLNKDNTYDLI